MSWSYKKSILLKKATQYVIIVNTLIDFILEIHKED